MPQLHVPIGWHLGARAHGTVDTGPAIRAATGPQGLPVQRVVGIVLIRTHKVMRASMKK